MTDEEKAARVIKSVLLGLMQGEPGDTLKIAMDTQTYYGIKWVLENYFLNLDAKPLLNEEVLLAFKKE